MSTDFRGEVFKLCKKLQRNEAIQAIESLVYSLSVTAESEETGALIKNAHGDFAYMAKHSNSEFHGYLFVDDNIETMEVPKFLKAEHLSSEERTLIEQGHRTLTRFIELCLSDIAKESSVVAAAMNPYFLYKEVHVSQTIAPLVSDGILQPAADAFKKGATYKALLTSNFTKIFGNIDVATMRILVGTIEKEINHSLGEDVSKDLKDFSMKLTTKLNNITDVMFAFSILMFALRESIKLACRTLYRAMCGVDLFVLDNDNIISIEKRSSNTVCEFYKVFAQEIHLDNSGSSMGSVLLLDCDPPNEGHIHEFGMLTAETLNLVGEFGQSAKYFFVTVNNELIHIHHLTEEILRVGLPTVITES